MAVPTAVISFDENTIRCKGRTAAFIYLKDEPVKFDIRLSTNAGWNPRYLHSFADNDLGNESGISHASWYCTAF